MLLLAPISPSAWIPVIAIPAVGMSVSLWSFGKIRRESDQYTGLPLAIAGFVLSLVFLVSGAGYGSYVYFTEVPDGYERISFETLRPTEQQDRGGIIVPPEVQALNGKRVFIKGYMRPASSANGLRTGIDRFLLVRDNNQCCFGDLSSVKYFDQMSVQITSSKRLDDTMQILRMGGILEINPDNALLGPGNTSVFSLKADYAVQ